MSGHSRVLRRRPPRVVLHGRDFMRYAHGERAAFIYAELQVGSNVDRVVHLSQLATWEAPRDVPVMEADRMEIQRAIQDEFPRLRIEWA
ncbi:MAG: Imm74 family immunity protein [Myxococcota bacterium]